MATPLIQDQDLSQHTGEPPSTVRALDDALREQIERRAYELYLQRGASEGLALDDWLQAERELGETRDS